MSRRRKEINIYRIAEEAQVSPSTVSRVLNRRVGVSPAVRQKVNLLLKKYSFSADYPRLRSHKLAVVCPYEISHYIRKALQGILSYVRDREMEASVVMPPSNSRHTILEQLRDHQYSAVIVLTGEHYEKEYEELTQSELPVVFLDMQIALPGAGFIDNDSYGGSCAATKHLLELGHRNIGYLHYLSLSMNHAQRLQGYLDTMRSAGLEPPPHHWEVANVGENEHLTVHQMRVRLTHHMLDHAPELTAVMAVDDELALDALTAIHERGLKIPEDISVVGFDNYPETECSFPHLTTVDHPIEQAGRQACAAIEHALNNPGKWQLPQKILPTKLVVRKSTGPVPIPGKG